MRKVVCLSVVLFSLFGCASEAVDGGGGTGGTGVAGAAGTSVAGAGGTGAGTGVAGMAGSAGTAAGTGGTGGGAPAATPGCSAADPAVMGSLAHAAAAEVLTADSPCGFSSCHAGTNGKANLVLANNADLRALLVGVASCQTPGIPLVADGGSDTALNNSWLWLKLTAPADAQGVVTANPAWGTAVNCGQLGNQPFGLRMPWSNSDTLLEEPRMAAVRNWICAGAPGP